MAKWDRPKMDYSAQLKRLRQDGPQRVYILRGDEDYLRDSYLDELKKLCLTEGTEAFNYHRVQGPGLDVGQLAAAVEAMPFMGERTLTEVRDFDVNKPAGYDPAALKAFLEDVPEWATVAFVFSPGYVPDSRLTAVKALRKAGEDLEFTRPDDGMLTRWVIRRMEGLDKTIDPATASYLIWVCGRQMNGLIPEITKVAGYAKGRAVTRADIDAVAKKAPETTVFQLARALGAGKYDDAARQMADLLADKDETPYGQLALISRQFRWLYVARVAHDCGRDAAYITACLPELSGRRDDVQRLQAACRQFSADRLARAVSFCARCDYAMKDTGGDPAVLLKQLLVQLAMDRT